MKQRLIYWCLVVVSLGGFASCKNDPTPDPPQTADRTVLVYMAADNSLTWNGDFGNKNLGQIVRAMDGLKGNMLVYIDLPSEGATSTRSKETERRKPLSKSTEWKTPFLPKCCSAC